MCNKCNCTCPSKTPIDWSKPLQTIGGEKVRVVGTISRTDGFTRACAYQTGFSGNESTFLCNDAGETPNKSIHVINAPERIVRPYVYVSLTRSSAVASRWASSYKRSERVLLAKTMPESEAVAWDCEYEYV